MFPGGSIPCTFIDQLFRADTRLGSGQQTEKLIWYHISSTIVLNDLELYSNKSLWSIYHVLLNRLDPPAPPHFASAMGSSSSSSPSCERRSRRNRCDGCRCNWSSHDLRWLHTLRKSCCSSSCCLARLWRNSSCASFSSFRASICFQRLDISS